MLIAKDRPEVLKWSQHHLGSKAGLASISEVDCMDAAEGVEKSGTGYRADEIEGCHPLFSIAADHRQGFIGFILECQNPTDPMKAAHLSPAAPTWH